MLSSLYVFSEEDTINIVMNTLVFIWWYPAQVSCGSLVGEKTYGNILPTVMFGSFCKFQETLNWSTIF